MSDLKQKLLDAVIGDTAKITLPYEIIDMLKLFFKQKYDSNRIFEFEELVIQLSEGNSEFFWDRLYPTLIKKLVKKYGQEELLRIEKNIVSNIYIKNQLNEEIVIDFIGTIQLPQIKVLEEGHIFLTNKGIFWIHWKSKVGNSTALYAAIAYRNFASVLIAKKVDKKIIRKRDEFMSAMEFYEKKRTFEGSYTKYDLRNKVNPLAIIPKIPFTVPYNITITYQLSFSMDYPYKEKAEDKVFRCNFALNVNRKKKEPPIDYIHRKEEIFSKIRDFLSHISENSEMKS